MATIKDVAKEAGLAVGTVSRILNNRGYISDNAREKVDTAMKKLNYRPNEMARSLQKKHSRFIGVIVPRIAHPYFAFLISCLEEAAYQNDYRILLLNSQGIPTKESEFMDLCFRNKVVGIILCNGNLDIARTGDFSVPVVTIERKHEGGDASIECDNEQGGRMAAEHLIENGCSHLLHINGVTCADMPAEKRGYGFTAACRQHRVQSDVVNVVFEDYRLKDAGEILNRILDEYPGVDGIFASDDILAAEMLKVCREREIHVPRQMKIVGFDDTDIAGLCQPSLTTIRQPVREIAECAVGFISRMFDNEPVPVRTILPVELVKRESTSAGDGDTDSGILQLKSQMRDSGDLQS